MQESVAIQRHRTAIHRPGLSMPIGKLLGDGLLEGSRMLFDYGCGHGQDIALLNAQGITCEGWDPVYRPESKPCAADVVNLGYVINVIENPAERADVIRRAWILARELLVVSAQVETPPPEQLNRVFADGVVTSRGTFQKYYTQAELRTYLESTVESVAVPAAPGVFYLFKEETEREKFLARKYQRVAAIPRLRISEARFEQNRDLMEPFIKILAQLGRLPAQDEFDLYDEIEDRFGSAKRAFSLVRRVTGAGEWDRIAAQRAEDLQVYLALSCFSRRPVFSAFPLSVQRDIKSFFGTFRRACSMADTLLFAAGDAYKINEACVASKVGQLVDNALLILWNSINTVGPLLRVYEGCARALIGEVDGAHVIKLHRFSSKVSYLVYHDFDKEEHPRLALRVKVTLPMLTVDFFDYTNNEKPSLLDKDKLKQAST